MDRTATTMTTANSGEFEARFGMIYGITCFLGILITRGIYNRYPGWIDRFEATVQRVLQAIGLPDGRLVDVTAYIAGGFLLLLAGCLLGVVMALGVALVIDRVKGNE